MHVSLLSLPVLFIDHYANVYMTIYLRANINFTLILGKEVRPQEIYITTRQCARVLHIIFLPNGTATLHTLDKYKYK